jgi:predicted DNA binding protein
MRQDRPLRAVKRDATRDKNDTAKYKTVKRKKDLKTSSWYERPASSIKAAPSQRRR